MRPDRHRTAMVFVKVIVNLQSLMLIYFERNFILHEVFISLVSFIEFILFIFIDLCIFVCVSYNIFDILFP